MPIRLLSVVAVLFALTLGAYASANPIVINPGPVGTSFTNKDFAFSELNGMLVLGQDVNVDFVFPAGVNAVYRYDQLGTRELYGWHVGLTFVGGTTVTSTPRVFDVYPLGDDGNPVFPVALTVTGYNSTEVDYYGNYNSTNSLNKLVAFTDVAYHGVRMTLRLPAFTETNVTVVSGVFSFNRNGSGESTEIVAAVPEPATLSLLALGSAVLLRGRHRTRNRL